MKAKISELFCSLQGEGIEQGEKQIFLRFCGCNLDCTFCDGQNKKAGEYILKEDLVKKIEKLKNFSRTISITGGEPLLQSDFLRALLPDLKAKKFRIYLESNGTLPQKLHKIIHWTDVIAMDIKLPSSTGLRSFWGKHRDFLKAAKMKKVFVKVVVTNKTRTEDIDKAVSLVSAAGENLPLVLQPVTPQSGTKRPTGRTLRDFKERAGLNLADVKIIPQFHKIWGVD